MLGQALEHAWNLQGDTRTHQDITHSTQHGSVQGRQVRNLDFFQVIDANAITVAFASEKYLDKISDDAALLLIPGPILLVLRQGLVRLALRLPAENVIGPPYPFSHDWKRKMIETATHMAT